MKTFVKGGHLCLWCGPGITADLQGWELGRKTGDGGKNHHQRHRTKENPRLSLKISILARPDDQQGKLVPLAWSCRCSWPRTCRRYGGSWRLSSDTTPALPTRSARNYVTVLQWDLVLAVSHKIIYNLEQRMIMCPFKVLLDGALSNGPTHRLFPSLASGIYSILFHSIYHSNLFCSIYFIL